MSQEVWHITAVFSLRVYVRLCGILPPFWSEDAYLYNDDNDITSSTNTATIKKRRGEHNVFVHSLKKVKDVIFRNRVATVSGPESREYGRRDPSR
jgi:hypothetical protein